MDRRTLDLDASTLLEYQGAQGRRRRLKPIFIWDDLTSRLEAPALSKQDPKREFLANARGF
jgi:hypothetical protein